MKSLRNNLDAIQVLATFFADCSSKDETIFHSIYVERKSESNAVAQ